LSVSSATTTPQALRCPPVDLVLIGDTMLITLAVATDPRVGDHRHRSRIVNSPPSGRYYHQQYLSDVKNPYGYCNHGPNGCPIGVAKTDA
jgi:hypothetical protein